MKHIKLFNNHSGYNTYISGDIMFPNVSYCQNENEVHFNPLTYDKMYFSIIVLEDGTITFTYKNTLPITDGKYMEYSVNYGKTWERINNVNNEEVSTTINVNQNDIILWRGDNKRLGRPQDFNSGSSAIQNAYFSSTCKVDVQGNIMSLLYNNFINKISLEYDYSFYYLFNDGINWNPIFCDIVNANNLILPAITLSKNCYEGMFRECSSLVTAPVLPATVLADDCYSSMFYNCESLTIAPELPAITLVNSCYRHMFYNCKSLETAPELPATTLASSCYNMMFYGCSFTTAPELPATTLASGCYNSMFQRCNSLVNAPELPATTLASSCYMSMFANCISLETAPELPATTLVNMCYYYMFNGCSSLNYIKAMFTTTPGPSTDYTGYTYAWVENVASTGTFVKNSAAEWNVTGSSGVPNGWTIQTAES